jgi:hypothetical protein
MRFDLQQNVMCLAYEHPLLLERSRGWAPENHSRAVENPQRPHPENGRALTTIEPDDRCRLEGEGGPESPMPVPESIAVPLENATGRRSDAP